MEPSPSTSLLMYHPLPLFQPGAKGPSRASMEAHRDSPPLELAGTMPWAFPYNYTFNAPSRNRQVGGVVHHAMEEQVVVSLAADVSERRCPLSCSDVTKVCLHLLPLCRLLPRPQTHTRLFQRRCACGEGALCSLKSYCSCWGFKWPWW